MQVALRYIGKKMPFTWRYKFAKRSGVLDFKTFEDIVLVESGLVEEILKYNPVGFVEVVGERSNMPVEIPVEKKVPPIKKPLVCETCGKAYYEHHRRHYENHIEKCGIEDDEVEMD